MTIRVEMIQASKCAVTGKEIFTLALEYPRQIHAQLLTHGVFSKNGSSSRAVPIGAAIDQVRDNPSKVIWTGKQSGMQGLDLQGDSKLLDMADLVHALAREQAILTARTLDALGIHKQNAGRYLEPFQNIRIVLTSTEWENWDWLRIDAAAQPEIEALAVLMKQVRDAAEPMVLSAGEWHVPFVDRGRDEQGEMIYCCAETGEVLSLGEAKNISMSVCAQTSYRKSDASLEKAEDMQDKLFGGKKIHASPSEHQASPIGEFEFNTTCEWPQGVTHMCRDYTFGSGNFNQWIQNRQLIKGHDRALHSTTE